MKRDFMRCGAIPGTTGAPSRPGDAPQQHQGCSAGLWGTPSAPRPPPQILALNTQDLGPFGCPSLWKPLLTVPVHNEPVCAAAFPEGRCCKVMLREVVLQVPATAGSVESPHEGLLGKERAL